MTAINDSYTHDTPRIGHLAASTLFAGAVATIAFDFFGQSISPGLGFANLAPVGLANGVITALFGTGWMPGAHGLHYLAGIVGYPLGWLLIADPVARRVAPGLPWIASAVAYGIVLWIFALYVMAQLIAGLPAFLGFSGITWVALVGHVVFAVVAAAVYRARGARIG